MSLCSSQENCSHIRLFHAVEQRYWSNEGGHVFVVLPQLADEARPLIAGLLTLLRWYVLQDDNNVDPKHLDKFFTASAVKRAASSRYNPETGEVETEEDNLLDSIDD